MTEVKSSCSDSSSVKSSPSSSGPPTPSIVKPGYKTTEFWLTILAQVIGLMVAFHAITPQEASTLGSALSNAVAAAATILASAQVVGHYIRGRTTAKLG